MGRLQDIAKQHGHKSLRALAFEMAPPKMPPPEGKKGDEAARHLTNMLNKLDRGEGVGWWSGPTGMLWWTQLLRMFDLNDQELHDALRAPEVAREEVTTGALFFFTMFEDLRPLDLSTEVPFPGVPSELTRSGGPNEAATWWVAPHGAGKTLVGRWLEARYGWTRVEGGSWTDIEPRLPETGRVYVELASAEGAPLGEIEGLRIVVASPEPAPCSGRDGGGAGTDHGATSSVANFQQPEARPDSLATETLWNVVKSPVAEEWLARLVDWVSARLRRHDGFHVAAIRSVVASGALEGWVETPGEALALFGAIQKYGLDPRDPLQWVDSWLQAAAARTDRRVDRGMVEHLRTHGRAVLADAARARLRDGGSAEAPDQSWAKWLKPVGAPEVDVVRLRELLETDLEAARRMLGPTGTDWIRTFETTQILHRTALGLSLQPHWLARLVEQRAFDELYAERPQGIGALLLHATTVLEALARLDEEFREGRFGGAEQAIEGLSARTPEAHAFLGGVVRAAALAHAQVPVDLAGRLWEAAIAVSRERWRGYPPVPLVGIGDVDRWRGRTATGAWYLSMLALSRRGRQGPRVATLLDPWVGTLAGPELQSLLEVLPRAAPAARGEPDEEGDADLARLDVEVGCALFETYGVLRHYGRIVAHQAAAIVVALSRRRALELSEEEHREVLCLPGGLAALRVACDVAEAKLGEVLAWCWQTWRSGLDGRWPPFAPLPNLSSGDPVPDDELRVLWDAMPPGPLCDHAYIALEGRPDLVASLASPPWDALFERWRSAATRSSHGASLFEGLPAPLVERALVEGDVNAFCHDIRRILWRRMPDALVALVDRLAREVPTTTFDIPGHGGPVMDLVWSTPPDRIPAMIARADTWLQAPDRYIGATAWVRVWLHAVIADRKLGWREAFALLQPHASPR